MYVTKLRSKKNLVADIWQFVFVVPHEFTWHGGQHVVAIVQHERADSSGISRALSIASAPHERQLVFVTHCPRAGSTYKQALKNLQVGDEISLTAAQDSFVANRPSGPCVYLAGGVGCAAIRSLLTDLDHALAGGVTGEVYCYAPSGEQLFHEDFTTLATRNPGLKISFLQLDGLHEVGGIKNVELRGDTTYYFSGVYAREMHTGSELAANTQLLSGGDEAGVLAQSAGIR
jgi:ferredoxin-NADP reductase